MLKDMKMLNRGSALNDGTFLGSGTSGCMGSRASTKPPKTQNPYW